MKAFIPMCLATSLAAMPLNALAVTYKYSLNVGALPLNTTNNELLDDFQIDLAHNQTPQIYTNWGLIKNGLTVPESTTTRFAFHYFFTVAQNATISQNATYATGVLDLGQASSVTFLQGGKIIEKAKKAGKVAFLQYYKFAPFNLVAGEVYELTIVQGGIPPSADNGPGGYFGAQIAADITASP